MKKALLSSFLVVLLNPGLAIAAISDEEHRLCSATGDVAEGALTLRYLGKNQDETVEFFLKLVKGLDRLLA